MSMKQRKLVSLCIPTNGVVEWVIPVLDSIYSQGINEDLYEVVVTDNGDNQEFFYEMSKYIESHDNLIYRRTQAYEFMNQVEAFKLANGELVKFINHRTKLLPGKLQYLIEFSETNKNKKCVIYFADGQLKDINKQLECSSFDEFVKNLSYYSSWSGGLCFWRDDFDGEKKREDYNSLFPHTDILFAIKDADIYVINNEVIFESLPVNGIAKGKYKLFKAFAVEYVSLLLDLVRREYISLDTFLHLKNENLNFVIDLYYSHVVRKIECSYDLSDAKKYISVYYSLRELYIGVLRNYFKAVLRKFIQI